MSKPYLSPPESEMVELLSTLIEQYEAVENPTPDCSPAEMLEHLLEVRGLSKAQLAREAGIPRSRNPKAVCSDPLQRVSLNRLKADTTNWQDGGPFASHRNQTRPLLPRAVEPVCYGGLIDRIYVLMTTRRGSPTPPFALTGGLILLMERL
jgi:hypothetical protein